MQEKSILFEVVNADALTFPADVLVLKHAEGLYGLDKTVFERLRLDQRRHPLPPLWHGVLHDTKTLLGAKWAAFIGVPPLRDLGYAQLRKFSLTACQLVGGGFHGIVRHIALTIHGPNFGLDENEAFESLLGGFVAAINTREFPRNVDRISFVEHSPNRAARLKTTLSRLLPGGRLEVGRTGQLGNLTSDAETVLRSAGTNSTNKPTVFVAMPFTAAKEDTYHYGIEKVVHDLDMLCERADKAAFTGDINQWVLNKIKSARLVVADLSGANPNVYLEVGYAWGIGIPTVLLCDDVDGLEFDVRGQRCIHYRSIKNLEQQLSKELKSLTK